MLYPCRHGVTRYCGICELDSSSQKFNMNNCNQKLKWISIEERLPELDEFFIAYGPNLATHVCGPNIDICLFDGDLWNEGGTELTDYNFTHWLPVKDLFDLPNAPKYTISKNS